MRIFIPESMCRFYPNFKLIAINCCSGEQFDPGPLVWDLGILGIFYVNPSPHGS